MGTPMALNLIKTGHNVSVYNRTQSKTEIFSEQGYSVYHTLRQIIENCDIVFGKGYDNFTISRVATRFELRMEIGLSLKVMDLNSQPVQTYFRAVIMLVITKS